MSVLAYSVSEKKNNNILSYLSIFLLFLYALLEFFPFHLTLNSVVLVFVCVFTCFYHLTTNRNLILHRLTSEAYIFLLFWLSYSLITYLWAADGEEALKYSLLIARYTVLFIIFSQFFLYPFRQKAMVIFFQVMIFIYLATAIWEIFTFQHLSVSGNYGIKTPLPTGPFYGPNVLAAFWLLLLPFMTQHTFLNKFIWQKILILLAAIGITAIVVLQGARIAMLSIILIGGYYFFLHASKSTKIITITIILISLFIFWKRFPQEWNIATSYAKTQIESLHSEAESHLMSSIKIRKQLVLEGADIIWHSGFLGVGGNNFEVKMNKERKYRAGWMTNAHNYLLEIFSNFGFIIFAFFVYLLYRWGKILIRLAKHPDPIKRRFYRAHLFSFLMFLPMSILPSSIRYNYLVWIYLAYIHAVCMVGIDSIKNHSNHNLNNIPNLA